MTRRHALWAMGASQRTRVGRICPRRAIQANAASVELACRAADANAQPGKLHAELALSGEPGLPTSPISPHPRASLAPRAGAAVHGGHGLVLVGAVQVEGLDQIAELRGGLGKLLPHVLGQDVVQGCPVQADAVLVRVGDRGDDLRHPFEAHVRLPPIQHNSHVLTRILPSILGHIQDRDWHLPILEELHRLGNPVAEVRHEWYALPRHLPTSS
mmetsp:Transcript_32441/g.98021  ORF Transcript_32441/g.98021 Transcript_32441/m.98021 type:complete len:214 (+) Transcript_32441:689-1330(+)